MTPKEVLELAEASNKVSPRPWVKKRTRALDDIFNGNRDNVVRDVLAEDANYIVAAANSAPVFARQLLAVEELVADWGREEQPSLLREVAAQLRETLKGQP